MMYDCVEAQQGVRESSDDRSGGGLTGRGERGFRLSGVGILTCLRILCFRIKHCLFSRSDQDKFSVYYYGY